MDSLDFDDFWTKSIASTWFVSRYLSNERKNTKTKQTKSLFFIDKISKNKIEKFFDVLFKICIFGNLILHVVVLKVNDIIDKSDVVPAEHVFRKVVVLLELVCRKANESESAFEILLTKQHEIL